MQCNTQVASRLTFTVTLRELCSVKDILMTTTAVCLKQNMCKEMEFKRLARYFHAVLFQYSFKKKLKTAFFPPQNRMQQEALCCPSVK